MKDAVRASGRPWTTRHEPQRARVDDLWSRTLRWAAQTRRSKEDPHTRGCEECDVAGSNIEHRGPREARKHEVIEEKSIRKSARSAPRICTPRTRPEERDATKAKEEAVENVAETMHECDQHE